jgi:hypothetical protein
MGLLSMNSIELKAERIVINGSIELRVDGVLLKLQIDGFELS